MRTLVLLGTAVVLAGCGGGSGAVAPVRSGTIAIPGEVSGTLTRRDQRLSDSSFYQAWSFFGTAGQNIQIDVVSSDFDAYAILQGPGGNDVARDDDAGGGTNARIRVALPTAGTYRILANAYRPGETGRFTVRLSAGPSQVITNPGSGSTMAGTAGQILRGQMVQGRLTASDARLADNTVYQAWTFYGQAGEMVTLDVMSTEFDAYAVIQDLNGNVLARDDDSGGGLNARVTFTLPYTGAFRLIANTLRQGAAGAYTLSVR
jgi:serine protease Do